MVDFFGMAGPFVIIFRGEGAAAFIKQTPHEVERFLLDPVTGVFTDDGADQLREWLSSDLDWHFDEDGEPFEWNLMYGDIGDVSVVKVTRDVPTVEPPEPANLPGPRPRDTFGHWTGIRRIRREDTP